VATKVIRASPIISAAAVFAVRPGLRTEFSLARRLHEPAGDERDADEEEQRAERERDEHTRNPVREEQPVGDQRERQQEQHGRHPRGPPREARARQNSAFAHGRDRRHARRLDRREEPGEQRHDHACEQRDDNRPRREHGTALRQVGAERDEDRVEALGDREAEEEPDQGGRQADRERLDEH
jgi:hypothetical protein